MGRRVDVVSAFLLACGQTDSVSLTSMFAQRRRKDGSWVAWGSSLGLCKVQL